MCVCVGGGGGGGAPFYIVTRGGFRVCAGGAHIFGQIWPFYKEYKKLI